MRHVDAGVFLGVAEPKVRPDVHDAAAAIEERSDAGRRRSLRQRRECHIGGVRDPRRVERREFQVELAAHRRQSFGELLPRALLGGDGGQPDARVPSEIPNQLRTGVPGCPDDGNADRVG